MLAALIRGVGKLTDSDKYRALEAECIRHAQRAFDDATKRKLEDLAQQWHQLAERAHGLHADGRDARNRS
jgi:hypothetical protein